ncbi:glycoside hydrolase family 13 protein [Chryseobacterium chendengshani]|uniref:glycoside hydrolase family 13 protein n=1 Tax=Chryseobacterium sp. LJ756 TaxID=2864113 RepID=UPI001C6402F8|nr:glycoside hydrolase family 13 protein [Chryseobacterium sp. LJ756]MBW7674051.1 glycoside hydrolase family 13 protein [Chryseobacterium sp. LJ756]
MKKITLLTLLLAFQMFHLQIQKVEPAFWWKGMKNPKLQILVYGKNIASNEIELSDGIKIKNIQKVENPNYVFVTVNTNEINVSKFKINIKKGSKNIDSYTYKLKERQPNSANRQSFSSKDVMYLIMPDRFANGNPSNDNTNDTAEKADRKNPGGRHGGDIEGIIKNLDYLKEMGVTALWNTPLLEDNEPAYSYHGYAQSDYYKIDPRYGTNEDYKRLAGELHQRDMKLIMDYVTNHWGSQSWIIKDMPSKDWIHYWKDGDKGFKRSNYRMTTQFDTNAAKIDAENCMDGWFDTTMPDMNQGNQLVVNYMSQNAIWWTEYAGLDGLRVDTYSYNDKKGIAEWTKRITDEYPNLNIVGEVWMHDQAQMSYWQKGSKISAIENYNSYLPSVMDFTLHDAIGQVFKENSGWDSGMQRVYDNFANDFLYPNINNILVFAENHDTQRFNESYPKIEDYKLAMSLVLTVRGIPQLYYGSEIGMAGDKGKGDGDIRRDFPGGWKDDSNNGFVQSGRTETQNQYFDFTKKLLNWRKSKEVIHTGKTLHYVPENNVYVYFRYNDKERIMTVINNNPEKQVVNLKRFSEGLKSFTKGKDIISDEEISLQNSLIISGKSSMILEIK